MKRSFAFAGLSMIILLPGCSSSGGQTGSAGTTAKATSAPGEAPPPAAVATVQDPAPQNVVPAPPSVEEVERLKKLAETLAALKGQEASAEGGGQVIVERKGRQLQKILKIERQHYALRGRLYNAVVADRAGTPIVDEDAEAYYIDLPADLPPSPAMQLASPNEEGPKYIVPMTEDQAEVVTPAISKKKIAFAEMSSGLPTAGMWRENFSMADLDGDGRPEIVSPPARLSGRTLQVFKLVDRKWILPKELSFDDPEAIGFEYGGLATGDFDRDGKIDIVYGRHGGGPAVAYNLGGFKFRIETRGLPKPMSTRAMAVGDLNADGALDIIAMSDEPEYSNVKDREVAGDASVRQPRPDGYVMGYDVRAFLQQKDGKFEEVRSGLDQSCFGYSISLFAPASDGGAPFFAGSCRYQGMRTVIRTYDPAAKTWSEAGEREAFGTTNPTYAESMAAHLGTATGTYRGFPAAFMSYIIAAPQAASRNVSGNGVSIYYRNGTSWQRKRVVKTVESATTSQGVATGDLDGDGLDDLAWADETRRRVRIFFQTPGGEFEELDEKSQPRFVNHVPALQIADVDGDGKRDVVVMVQYLTGDETRSGGFRVFRNLR